MKGEFFTLLSVNILIMELESRQEVNQLDSHSLKNCRACGKVFMHLGGPVLCEDCTKELDEIYFDARDEIRRLPAGEDIDNIELAQKLDVDPVFIQIMMEEGLFEQDLASSKNAREALAEEFSAELKKLSRQRETGKSYKGSMFIDERRDKK
jgi:hypothetical protein